MKNFIDPESHIVLRNRRKQELKTDYFSPLSEM